VDAGDADGGATTAGLVAEVTGGEVALESLVVVDVVGGEEGVGVFVVVVAAVDVEV